MKKEDDKKEVAKGKKEIQHAIKSALKELTTQRKDAKDAGAAKKISDAGEKAEAATEKATKDAAKEDATEKAVEKVEKAAADGKKIAEGKKEAAAGGKSVSVGKM